MNLGGIVNEFPDNKILLPKNLLDYPRKVNKIINFFRFPNTKNIKSEIILFGSYNLRAQPYYADFDTLNLIYINKNYEETAKIVVKHLKSIIKKIEMKKGWFFTDCKAGLYEDGEAIHWTSEEIYKGKRNKNADFNGHFGNKNLIDAVKEHALLKVDMVCPYYDKYIEATVVYLIKYKDGYFNYDPEWLEAHRVVSSIGNDALKQLNKGKYFKVIKRMFAILRYSKNEKYINIIKPLINSNISKLSSIGSDLSTLALLLELNKPININFTAGEVQSFKEKISNMLDLNVNPNQFDNIFDCIYVNLINRNLEKVYELLNCAINLIQKINNNEIINFFNSKNINFLDLVNSIIKDSHDYLYSTKH